MIPRSVVIIGAGPAGAALAAWLARGGVRTALFDSGRRPELIVGESLIPSVVLTLRDLGIEEEVRQFSTWKPGASFYLNPHDEATIVFGEDPAITPAYSYNVPRAEFDAAVLGAARRAGAAVISGTAELQANSPADRLTLSPVSLAVIEDALGGAPDLIIDASGRSRLITKMLGIGERHGGRRDTALFAHLTDVAVQHEGHIHINRLRRGWSWRIPLPGRVSVGFVIGRDALAEYGRSAEEQYDRLTREEPVLSRYTAAARRLTPVMKYTNYQLISDRFYGANWALVGDAAGFVDPIFSSGLHLGLEGARILARSLLTRGTAALPEYERDLRQQLRAWQHVAESFYDGNIFGLTRAGRLQGATFPWRFVLPHCERHLRRVLTGRVPTRSYSFRLSRSLLRTGLGLRFGERLRVR